MQERERENVDETLIKAYVDAFRLGDARGVRRAVARMHAVEYLVALERVRAADEAKTTGAG